MITKRLLLNLLVLFMLLALSGCARSRMESMPMPPPLKYKPLPPSIKPVQPIERPAPVIGKKGLIVLDPGHGGKDFGTHSLKKPKYQEKFLTLSTAFLVRDYLEKMGYQVIMTRKEDKFIALDKRAEIANQLKPLIFVSLHYNFAASKEASGVEVYYYKTKETTERSKKSKQLADQVLKKILAATQAKSRGVKHGNFAVIRETEMPAILVEGGFLSNPEERDLIKSASYLKKLAWGIAQGIETYLD